MMNEKFVSSLAYGAMVAAAAAVAAVTIVTNDARADDITIDTTPFVSTADKAQVRAEARERLSNWKYGYNESDNYNEVPVVRSGLTAAQVRAEYLSSRPEVAELNREDSGSMYFAKVKPGSLPRTTVMGAPAR